MKKIILSAVALLVLAASGFADDLKGRDVAVKGNVQTLEGSLANENNEWYVVTPSGKYQIHMGPEFYQDEIGLKFKSNENVKIKGYVYQNSIAPQTVSYKEKDYSFRDNDGRPLWSGRGNRRNENANLSRHDDSHNDRHGDRDGAGNGYGRKRR